MANGAKSDRREPANRSTERLTVLEGSGNVFADVRIRNPEIALAKAELVQRIRRITADRKLTQIQTAELLGIDQPKVSALLRGRVDGYSLDRLIRCLNALGQRVEIQTRPCRPNSRLIAVI